MRELVALWAILRKDLSVSLRQPVVLGATITPALVTYLVIFLGAAAVGRNPVALVVEDHGPHAQQLVDVLENSDAFKIQEVGPAEAHRDLNNLAVAAVITVPAGFDAAYDARQPDPVGIEINNLNLDFTNDLRRSLPATITEFYAKQTPDPLRIQVAETDLRKQDVDLNQFDLVPNLVLLLTIAGIINSGLSTAREFEEKTIKELLLAPISRASLIVGKLLAGWIFSLLVGGVILLLGAVTGMLRLEARFVPETLGIVALIALASAGLGVALGAAFRRFQPTVAVGINLSLYLFFLSGGISVAAFLPDWIQTIAHFVPTYYGVHALQMAIFYSSREQLGLDVSVLAATAFATVALGVLSLQRRDLA